MKPIYKIALAGITAIIIATTSACSDSKVDTAEQIKLHEKSATTYLEQGQYRAAIIEARNIIKYSPNSLEGHLLLAKIYNTLDDGTAAAATLTALKDNHSKAIALALAKAYILSGKFISAQHQLDNYPDRKDPQYLLLQAKIFGMQRQFDKAINLLKSIAPDSEESTEARLDLVRLYLASGERDTATKQLKQLRSEQPHNPHILYLSARLSLAENDTDTAVEQLTSAVGYLPEADVLTPTKARILKLLADSLTRQGHSAEALIYTKMLAKANPKEFEAERQYKDALKLYQEDKLSKADAKLTALNQQHPDNTSVKVLQGMVKYRLGDLKAASKLLGGSIDVETAPDVVIGTTALAQLRLRQPEKAIALLKKTTSYRSDDPSIKALYGIALLSANSTDEKGAKALQEVLAKDPKRPGIRLYLAQYYMAVGKEKEAYEQYQDELKLDPKRLETQLRYVNNLIRNGRTEKALTLAEKFRAASPKRPANYVLAAKTYYAAHDLKKAEQRLKQAIALDNRDIVARLNLGQLYLLSSRPKAAETTYREIIALKPESVIAYKGLISSMELQGKGDAILKELNETVQKEKNNASLAAVLAEYYLKHHHIKKAETLAERALDINRDQNYSRNVATAAYREGALTALKNHDYVNARKQLAKAEKISPNNGLLLSDRVAIELADDNIQEALNVAQQVGELYPKSPLSDYLLGKIYYHQEQWDKSVSYLKNAWSLQPNRDIGKLLYATLIKGGHQKQADAFLDDWIKRFPKSDQPKLVRAIHLQSQGDNESAIAMYKAVLAINPNNLVALNNLAWLKFREGDDSAVQLAQRAYKIAPANASVLDTYGWILLHHGEVKQGKELLAQARSLLPDNKEIQAHVKAAEKL